MSVERNLPIVRERKLAILKGDPELCDKQKKAGKLLARERVARLFDASSFVELDVLNADYVRTARAKGLTKQQAIRKHALRTSLIPVTAQVAFTIPLVFTGAVITETIFNWRGMGSYFITTLNTNDVHGTVAVAAFGALMTAIGAILADAMVVILDPRVRVS